MNAKFNFPDFVTGHQLYTKIIELQRQYPEIFIPNTEISAIFGNFRGCLWNGGGISVGGSMTRNEMEDIVNHYNYDLHIPLRLTFTNVFCSEQQTYDTYANVITEVCHNGENQILVVNATLEHYLRKNYPNFKYCRSIIGARDVPYSLHGNEGDYYLSVMQRIKNNDWEYLDTIPMEDRAHIEFLCTDPCPDKCPRLYTHYRDFARCQIECREPNESENCSMFDVKGPFQQHYMQTELKTYISREMIDTQYLPKGFNEFKLSGRNSYISIIIATLNYLILPEFRDDVLVELLNVCGIM